MVTNTKSDKATASIGTKATPAFANAVTYFAEKSQMSMAEFQRSALMRRAKLTLDEHHERIGRRVQTRELMADALQNERWEKLTLEHPESYPSTREGWMAEIKRLDEIIAEGRAETKTMQTRLNDMGLHVFVYD